ncbi:MAG: hypothetical protein RLY93_08665 [Sumerlaeia bacterium]
MTRTQRRMFGLGLAAAVIGGLASAAGWLMDPASFFPAYLTAWLVGLGFGLGGLTLRLVDESLFAHWGHPIRPMLNASSATLPVLAVAFVPMVLWPDGFFAWSRPEIVAESDLLQKKIHYLNDLFFFARAAGYFVLWVVLALLVGGRMRRRGSKTLGAFGLIAVLLSGTFAAVDWTMSIEPEWFSTGFPLLFLTGCCLQAFALTMLTLGPGRPLDKETRNSLGKLLLTLVMLWTYLQLTHYIIIWSGNISTDAFWYQKRSTGGWQWLALAMLVFASILPFLALLSRFGRQSARVLPAVAALVLAMRAVEVSWIVVPAFDGDVLPVVAIAAAGLLAICGLQCAAFAWDLGRTGSTRAKEADHG